ncbi:RsmB/NOP family class I SAM-dependent RNA methyltransferase [Loktanella sp. IMCC34160]|uniref:RsmB/NOP family class I SAM-dependent RNA methyltransferase n=1 Tax=Loktanella sp. IMCC34160 TaxID=2510646 RepID=UPI00101CB516|nr:RsmB/NOP family class I SAM-dependent RNA methyltransferase [Loktanella sp. IMCC34160]RYG92228.1 RsmB/NOP family class I SAM-dependent RNA methyltransferase [Loktanella sp. IMCC34160]
MTPAARVSAAIEILDEWLAGTAAEKALTNWARRSRFAGSKDRAAIRDHVFDAIRCRRSFAALGGAETGRGLMIGKVRSEGIDLASVFTGEGHAPAPVTEVEDGAHRTPTDIAERLDSPDWLWPRFVTALGEEGAIAALSVLQTRAPVTVRVNTARGDIAQAMAELVAEGIGCVPVENVKTALHVIENERKMSASQAFISGLVELQDAASQAAVLRLGPLDGRSVLDYCAGGGGKSLALAAQGAQVTAHDIAPRRMADIPNRAARAGTRIDIVGDALGSRRFDIVFCDAPCSGSGTWRRTPEAKWALTEDRLADLCAMQDDVLDHAVRHVAPGGRLAYATCSVFRDENEDRVKGFLSRHRGWLLVDEMRLAPTKTWDGFYLALLETHE